MNDIAHHPEDNTEQMSPALCEALAALQRTLTKIPRFGEVRLSLKIRAHRIDRYVIMTRTSAMVSQN